VCLCRRCWLLIALYFPVVQERWKRQRRRTRRRRRRSCRFARRRIQGSQVCHLCASACKCVRVGDTGGGRGGRGRGGGGGGGDDDDDDDDDGTAFSVGRTAVSRGSGSKAARCVSCVRVRSSVCVWVTREGWQGRTWPRRRRRRRRRVEVCHRACARACA